ncbi:MAG: chromate efflux transporter [Tepidisphaeraceae bacterium]|jgi:chromate transporter
MPLDPTDAPSSRAQRLGEVARYFTQLGFTAFGGPAAHIALMERQLVEQRRWLDRQHFLDALSAINLIPGPNSTQLAITIGYLRAGLPGLFAAGICFIFPAVLIILPIAYAYVEFGQTPHAAAAMHGVAAAVLAVIAVALVRLAKTSVANSFQATIAIAAALAAIVIHYEGLAAADPLILLAAAVAGVLRASPRARQFVPMFLPLPLAAAIAQPAGLTLMALLFLKIGATLYGSGYLLLPYLQANFVGGHAWLTNRQLLDAVAVGQVTPGPLLTTATFIGFLVGFHTTPAGSLPLALAGAIIATAAIFGPSFLFIAVLGKLLPRLRNHPAARGALDAMNAAVLALIAVALCQLAPPALRPPGTLVWVTIFAATLLVLLRWDVNATWPILAAAAIGLVAGAT